MTVRLITLQSDASLVTTQTMDGHDYLVAPVVAIRAGVLNGELVPAAEIEKSVILWNDAPLPINHPMLNGTEVSARSLDVIKDAVVGRLYNVHYEDGRLKGELWVDVEKAEALGGEALVILERLRGNEPLEVSTCYYADLEFVSGTFQGTEYNAIQHNLRPDHLALLPTGIGACSWVSGCGAPRTNAEEGSMTLRACLKEGESYEMRRDALEQAVKAAMIPEGSTGWSVYVNDIYEDHLVFEVNEPDRDSYHVKDAYTVDANLEVKLSGEAVEVKREVAYTEMEAQVRGTARSPKYDGIESTRWSKPSLSQMIAGYVKHTGKEKPEGAAVADLPSAVKTWIASKTLLGDAAAEETRDLIFFPCVNPGTNKLNENALKAVLGGRGAQADIPEAARTSARAKAKALLVKEFGMKTQAEKGDGFLRKLFDEIKTHLGGMKMSGKETAVAALLQANVGLEEEALQALDEDVLIAWQESLSEEEDPEGGKPKKEEEDPEGGKPKEEGEETPKGEMPDPTVTAHTTTAVDELLKEKGVLVDQIVAHVKAHEAEANKEKKSLVDALVANKRCMVTKEALEGMETDVLRQLASAYEPANFLGAGVPHSVESIPRAPAVVLASPKKEGE